MLPGWLTALIRYFSFYGRLPRKEFWKLYATNCVIGIVSLFFSIDAMSVYLTGQHLLIFFVFSISMLPSFLVSEQMAGVFMFLGAFSLSVLMAISFSLLSMLIRRLHDINLSAGALFSLVFISPLILWFLFLKIPSHFSTSLFLYCVVLSIFAGLIGFIPGFRGRNAYGDDPLSLETKHSADFLQDTAY